MKCTIIVCPNDAVMGCAKGRCWGHHKEICRGDKTTKEAR